MAKAPAKTNDDDVRDEDFRAKHEDTIGTVDVKNDNPPNDKQVPDEDAGYVDPDDQELAAAQAALNAEQGAPPDQPAPAEPGPNDPPQDPQQPQAKPNEPTPDPKQPAANDASQPQEPAGDDQPMVPLARLNEVLRDRDEMARTASYYRGIYDATRQFPLGQQGQPGDQGQPQQPQQPPQDPMADLRGKRLEIARQYEAGEISVEDWVTQNDEIEEQLFELRVSQQQRPQQPTTQAQEDLYLAERTKQIAQEHQYLGVIPDEDLEFLVVKARNEMGFGNRDDLSSTERLALRMKVGELSDTYGPAMAQAAGIQVPPQQPSQQQPQQPGQQQMSPQAQQRQAKLAMAANHPPDVQNLGSAAQPNGQPNDDQIAAMGDEELIERLPQSTQDRIMGIGGR